MKKILAFLLVLVMVLPMCFVAQAEDANTAIKPFYLINWQDDITDYDNIYQLLNLKASYEKGASGITMSINCQGLRASDIPTVAQIMKDEFDCRPDGTRYINYPLAIDSIVEPEAMIYLDEAVRLFNEWNEAFFSEYKRIGGKLDGVILDVEYNGVGAYYINQAYTSGGAEIDPEEGTTITLTKNTEIYNNIVNHPLYATEIRPQLEARGFKFTEPSGTQSEIYSISNRGSRNQLIWDAVMKNRMCEYMNEACAPVLNYYPDITISNYRYLSGKGWQSVIGESGQSNTGGNTMFAGNTANENFYLRRPSEGSYDAESGYKTPAYYYKAVYEATPFHALMSETDIFKSMAESVDGGRMSAWVAGFNYKASSSTVNGLRLTPYFSEAIYHIALTTTENLIGYIVGPRDTDLKGEPYDYEDNMLVFHNLLNELTRVAGAADRKPIAVPTQWNSSFILSGVSGGGKNIWRLTPDIYNGTTLESFKISDSDPTFKIDGQTVTFPGGKIIADGPVSYIGSCGYWIETAADVSPVITSDADRFSQFPAFSEDFNGYETGMEFNYYNTKYNNTWLFKKVKSATMLIEDDQSNPGNKVLALTGNLTLRCFKMPANITAGDTYAENQAWEMAVTIPSGMGEDAEVTALSVHADSEKPIDGGFQFKGGKLYYADAGKFVAFEGLDVSAGGTFILKRHVDFNDAKALNCDYIVCNAAGEELASVKDIPMAEKVELPVQAIGFNLKNVSGTVYIDNFKLYANGVGVDFNLYDAEHGTNVEDVNVARNRDTAYRLSWMNATAYDKVYTVVAAYYNGDSLVEEKVIKEVKMAPGTSGVETGTVAVAEGQNVLVYLRNDSPPEPTEGDADTKAGLSTEMLIIIIAGAVILVAVILFVIVIVSAKKKSSAAAEENTEESADETAEDAEEKAEEADEKAEESANDATE